MNIRDSHLKAEQNNHAKSDKAMPPAKPSRWSRPQNQVEDHEFNQLRNIILFLCQTIMSHLNPNQF